MILQIYEIENYLNHVAFSSFQKKLENYLNDLKRKQEQIKLPDFLAIFYKNHHIVVSTTLKRIINEHFKKREQEYIQYHGSHVIDFMKENSSLSAVDMAHALEVLDFIHQEDSLEKLPSFSKTLIRVLNTNDPKALASLILTYPSAFFIIVITKNNLPFIFNELSEYPQAHATIWQASTIFRNTALTIAIKSQRNLLPVLEAVSQLDLELQAQVWSLPNKEGSFPLFLAFANNLELIFKTTEAISTDERFKLWKNSSESSFLLKAIEKRIDFTLILKELGTFNPEQQLALWQEKNQHGDNALMLIIDQNRDIIPILVALDSLTPEQRFLLWREKNKKGETILTRALKRTSDYSMASIKDKNFITILEASDKFLLDQQVMLWQEKDHWGNTFLSTLFQMQSTCYAVEILTRLKTFSQDAQFSLWREKNLKGNFSFFLALKREILYDSSGNSNIELYLEAFSRLTPEQQYALWATHFKNQSPLFKALLEGKKIKPVLRVLKQLTDEQQFTLLMEKHEEIYYLTYFFGYTYYNLHQFLIDLAEKMKIDFWPNNIDDPWYFSLLFQQAICCNGRCLYNMAKLLVQQPISKQIAFWLWPAKDGTIFLRFALRYNQFDRKLEKWSLIEQLTLAKSIIGSKKLFQRDAIVYDNRNYQNLMDSIGAKINAAISQLDNCDSIQYTIKTCLKKMHLNSLGKKIDIMLLIESLRQSEDGDVTDFPTRLKAQFENSESALFQAFNEHRSTLHSFFKSDTASIKKITKVVEDSGTNKINYPTPADRIANFSETTQENTFNTL